jgi:hypothetical protein
MAASSRDRTACQSAWPRRPTDARSRHGCPKRRALFSGAAGRCVRLFDAMNRESVILTQLDARIAFSAPIWGLACGEVHQVRRIYVTRCVMTQIFDAATIAGEDDLDAPEIANEPPQRDKAAEVSLTPNSEAEPASARSNRLRTTSQASPPSREKLSVEESATATAQLIHEIQTLPEDDLQSRAIAFLKAKNRLSADDAKQVEEAFAARMAPQDASSDVAAPNESASILADSIPPRPPSASTDSVKRPRGRPRKVKPPIEVTDATPIPPGPVVADHPAPPSTHLQADATAAKIQKSELVISEPRRHRDKAHLRFVASQPCLVCGRSPADAHHLRFTQLRAMGRKVSDEFTVPLCRTHHRDNHSFGDGVAWWERRAIDPVATSRVLWVSTRRIE